MDQSHSSRIFVRLSEVVISYVYYMKETIQMLDMNFERQGMCARLATAWDT